MSAARTPETAAQGPAEAQEKAGREARQQGLPRESGAGAAWLRGWDAEDRDWTVRVCAAPPAAPAPAESVQPAPVDREGLGRLAFSAAQGDALTPEERAELWPLLPAYRQEHYCRAAEAVASAVRAPAPAPAAPAEADPAATLARVLARMAYSPDHEMRDLRREVLGQRRSDAVPGAEREPAAPETDLDKKIAAALAEADALSDRGQLVGSMALVQTLAGYLRQTLQTLQESEDAWARERSAREQAEREREAAQALLESCRRGGALLGNTITMLRGERDAARVVLADALESLTRADSFPELRGRLSAALAAQLSQETAPPPARGFPSLAAVQAHERRSPDGRGWWSGHNHTTKQAHRGVFVVEGGKVREFWCDDHDCGTVCDDYCAPAWTFAPIEPEATAAPPAGQG